MTIKSIRKRARRSKKNQKSRINRRKNNRIVKKRNSRKNRSKSKSKSRRNHKSRNLKTKSKRNRLRNVKGGGQVTEKPVPKVEDPGAEEPVAEEPVAEEPVAEEPVAEEPVAEEPVAEEPEVKKPGFLSNLFGKTEKVENETLEEPTHDPQEELTKLIKIINDEIDDGKMNLDEKKKVIINIIRESIGDFENEEMKENLRKLADIIDKIDPKVEMSPEEIKEICSGELDYKNNTDKSSSMTNLIIAFVSGLLTTLVIAEGIPLVKNMVGGGNDDKNQ
jgi:polyhydroxyalkanoate synthesis regulator phasin